MLLKLLALVVLIEGRSVLSSCSSPLGMEDGRIKDSQITASSFYKDPVGPAAGRLYNERGGGAWCPQNQIKNMETQEFLEIDLEYNHVITAVVTQGRFDKGNGREFVEFYIVQYWREGMEAFVDYTDVDGEKILEANTNTFAAVEREFKPAVIASKIRIVPVSKQEWTVCLRVELKGCLITELDSPYWIGVAVGIFITVILLLVMVIIFIFYKNNRTQFPATVFTGKYISAFDPEPGPGPRRIYRSRTLPLTPTSSEDNYTDSSSVYSGPLFQPNKAHFRTLQGVNTWHNKVTRQKSATKFIYPPPQLPGASSSRFLHSPPQPEGSRSCRSPCSCSRSYSPPGGTSIWQMNARPWLGIGNRSFARDCHPSDYHPSHPSDYHPCHPSDFHPCHPSEYHPYNPSDYSRSTYLSVSSSNPASDLLKWSLPARSSVCSSTQAVSLCSSTQAASLGSHTESSSSSENPSGGLLCHVGGKGGTSRHIGSTGGTSSHKGGTGVTSSHTGGIGGTSSPTGSTGVTSSPTGGTRVTSRNIGSTGGTSTPTSLQKTSDRTNSGGAKNRQRKHSPILAYGDLQCSPITSTETEKEKEGKTTIERLKKMSKPVINWKTFFPSPPPIEPVT